MTQTYDLSTDIGKVRFYTTDTDVTDSTTVIWSDAEIQFALDEKSGVKAATILLLRNKIVKLAQPDYKADWLEEKNHKAAAETLKMALDELIKDAGITTLTASTINRYRQDSYQTEEPDYSDGI